jgi:hypothetical protein
MQAQVQNGSYKKKKSPLVQSLERYPKCSSWRSSGMEINHQGTHNLFIQRLNPQVWNPERHLLSLGSSTGSGSIQARALLNQEMQMQLHANQMCNLLSLVGTTCVCQDHVQHDGCSFQSIKKLPSKARYHQYTCIHGQEKKGALGHMPPSWHKLRYCLLEDSSRTSTTISIFENIGQECHRATNSTSEEYLQWIRVDSTSGMHKQATPLHRKSGSC